MAAKPFPCNGILLIQGILPRVFTMYPFGKLVFQSPISNYFKIYYTKPDYASKRKVEKSGKGTSFQTNTTKLFPSTFS